MGTIRAGDRDQGTGIGYPFADACKDYLPLGVVILILFLLVLLVTTGDVKSQYTGNVGLATTVANFSYTANSGQKIIGVCSATQTTNCIKMVGQSAHLITVNSPAYPPCRILLDGSFDGSQWQTLAQIDWETFVNQAPTQALANGYFPVLRLKINPTGDAPCTTGFTGAYQGFQTPLTPFNVNQTFARSAISTPVNVLAAAAGSTRYYLVDGFQCTNTNASTAYLELSTSQAAPTLGTGNYIYEFPIPAGQAFTYPGPPWMGTYLFWASAVTASNGNTAVTTALECDFQMNFAGPFAPFNPNSP